MHGRPNMKFPRLLVLTVLICTVVSAGPDIRFEPPPPALELVISEQLFRPFAELVRAEVERLLGVPEALDDPGTMKLLLSTRVHLAHHFGDNRTAIATAAWIRSLQTDPANRAFAGLTTLASVEARRRLPGVAPGDPKFRETFRSEFAKQLLGLPKSPEIVTMLQGQLDKIKGITEETLLAEARDVIAPAIRRRGYCGLQEADMLVRVRHRLESIVPVRDETLSALEEAIAARSSQ